MFCDVVDSTALSAHLDPEELRDVIDEYQQTCAAVIQRYDGHIAQYLGDGLLVYFGYPNAHEDDARRAVRAGLEITQALHTQVPPPLKGERQGEDGNLLHWQKTPLPQRAREIQVRIGIHTGPVVVSEIGGGNKREQLALGETPNVAARIQGIAVPNSVVLSAATHRLVAGFFACQDLGAQLLKGIATPVVLYQVLAESTAQHHLDTAPPIGLTPLVGREEELALLQRRWEYVKEWEGQAVLLSGEPGIGKSRLVRELRKQVEKDGAICIEFRCSPYHQNSALHPVIEHLHRVLNWHKDDTPQTRLTKLRATLARYRFPQANTETLFAALLSLPQPAEAPPLNLSPQRQKQKTVEAWIAWLVEETERAPVYCVWEDLHWADPSTLELLGLLLDQTPTTRLFVLLTGRPEFAAPWGQHGHFSQLTLSRLGRRQVPRMIEQATGGKTLPAEVVQQIVAKTDGVPLFVEELTKMVLESELLTETSGHYELRGPLPPLAIPCTLQDSLMARLDRLATTKEIAQIGATLGREFSYDLLHAVSPVEENTLRQGLSQLVAAELLYQRGVPPQSSYLFKHALIQDTAYHSLLKSRRQQLHQQIAQALEDRFPDTKATQPELLAHHYTEAGLIAHAVPYWRQAGQNAIQRSAYLEAINHLTKGLEVLKTLPDTPERVWQELALQLALGPALLAAKGWTVPEVEQAYTRAQELGQQVGAASQLLPALWGLWVFHSMRGEVRKGRELGQKLLTLAQNIQDPAPRLVAHMALGYNSYHLGDIVSARDHLEQSAALYDPQQHHALASLYGGADPQVLVLSITAWTLWMLGYPDRALETVHKAGTLARELSHPHSLAFALCFAVELLSFRREAQIAHEQAETTIALCREQEFPFWLERVSITQGWALAGLGQGEDGIRQIRQSLAAYQARGAELFRPYFLALLAEAYIKVGQLEEGSAVLSEALALVDRTEERWYEGELYRLKGELLLKKSESRIQKSESSPEFSIPNTQHLILSTRAEVEGCFWRAIEIARQQQAKSLELRATVSLTRLWQQQGRRQEARTLLAEIYGWFTEGFDTKDLQEAKALLTELAEGV